METKKIDSDCINIVNKAINVALDYENLFNGKRKLGITGEVGEILACQKLNLKLVLNTINEGFDAIDEDGKKVQIKCCRSETLDISPNIARVGRFSNHPFDFAILVLLGRKYEVKEIWRAEYDNIIPLIEANARRNPNIGSFKSVGKKVGI